MSLRVIPASTNPTTVSSAASGAPSVASVPDPLRSKQPPHSVAAPLNEAHSLESRLKNWDATQYALKMEGLRRAYGAAEPMRRGMEALLCQDYVPTQLGGPSNLHKDILEGRDTSIEWEDVFKGNDNIYELPDFHTELEARCRMNW